VNKSGSESSDGVHPSPSRRGDHDHPEPANSSTNTTPDTIAFERYGHAGRMPDALNRVPLIGRAVVGLPTGTPSDAGNLNLMGEVLGALPAGHSIVFSLTFEEPDGVLRTGVELFAAEADAGSTGLTEPAFEQVLALALPGARFEPMGERACLSHVRDIRPQALDLATTLRTVSGHTARLAAVTDTDVHVPLAPRLGDRAFNLSAALQVLACAPPAELRLSLHSIKVDAPLRRGLNRLGERLAARAHRLGDEPALRGLSDFISDLLNCDGGIKIDARVAFEEEPSPLTLDLIAIALFGTRASHNSAGDVIDLTTVWPCGWPLPRLVPTAIEANLSRGLPSSKGRAGVGSLVIGQSIAGRPIQLTGRDRARHIYVVGATGSGKSTLLLNLMAQDFRAGECVILIDPHGDLADDARALVPESRSHELVFANAADADGDFALNILTGQGGDPAVQRNYVANALIRIFARVLYAGIPEAFGPMFELYFRNALLLLMEAEGANASLLDFESVFHDDAFRRRLLERCTDPKVLEFWNKIAAKVTHDEISLPNIAPYITCKLAQFTGNPLLRRILCGRGPGLDLSSAMRQGRIIIIKAPKGLLGQSDTELLCALVVMAIAQAGMARAALPRNERRPVRLYIDEFQTCAGDGLADVLAEARKFGLSLVLANQSLGQVDGIGHKPGTGAAALANAANLIAFRVGAPDAARLGPWFAPDLPWTELCRLRDFHAAVRVLDDGRPAPAHVIRMERPPFQDGRSGGIDE
jgi:hypothetical protein